jgi:acyl-[acyl-carrier-protein]-phospholipid O-acyltransferase/long-chain-fatty-acid--[acyl-carrier-protein] ligase
MAIRITDAANDRPLPIHSSGMIWLRGANIFQGYLKMPQQTEEVLHDGWFRTGDVGRLDADGFLYIEGRLSRFSKIGGEMVPHETVELAVTKALGLDSDSEKKVAVVGIPDDAKGEALILLTTIDMSDQSLVELRYSLLEDGIASLWIPKRAVRVEEIPVLASGKLDIQRCEKLAKSEPLV